MSVLPKRFCFRFSVRCHSVTPLWLPAADVVVVSAKSTKRKADKAAAAWLTDRHILPAFDELEGAVVRRGEVAVRCGWCPEGFAVSLRVRGKSLAPWCRVMSPEESDGLHLFLDTRDVRDVHRATRFCHRFLLMPLGGGAAFDQPAALWLPIARAKAVPNSVDVSRIKIRANVTGDGYDLDAAFPTDILTGFDPLSHNRLGFHYAITDRELGSRHWITPATLPHDQDPSLWGTLELVE